MDSKMMTRSAVARRTEEQLRVALAELKQYKDQCQMLLRERDDNEKEMLSVLQKNKELKLELNKLSLDFDDIQKQNMELQSIVNGFDQCREEYENTLKNSANLKIKLNNAEDYILKLEEQIHVQSATQTQTLFDELICNKTKSILEFMNTNWKDVLAEAGEPIHKAITAKAVEVAQKLYNYSSDDELYVL